MNGTRLGMFGAIRTIFGIHSPSETSFFFVRNVAAGATAGIHSVWLLHFSDRCLGVISACLGSPFYLVKTRLQAQAHHSVAVGHQYRYKYSLLPFIDCTPNSNSHSCRGMVDGFHQIIKTEGVKGLFRGIQGVVNLLLLYVSCLLLLLPSRTTCLRRTTGIALRVAVGSATQLATYEQTKGLVRATGLFPEGLALYFASSVVSGLMGTRTLLLQANSLLPSRPCLLDISQLRSLYCDESVRRGRDSTVQPAS